MGTAAAVTAPSVATLQPRIVPVTVGPAGGSVATTADGGLEQTGSKAPQVGRNPAGSAATDQASPDQAKLGADATGGVIATINPTFKYDAQTERMVMVTRDRKTGAVETQIPSEMALRQYQQAAKRVREDVATAQQSGTAPSNSTALTAATLDIVLPYRAVSGSSTVGAGRTGNARYNIVV